MQIAAALPPGCSERYGSGGPLSQLDNFSNLVYTGLLDPTTLTTPGGRAFLHTLGGAAGDEIANGYVKVNVDQAKYSPTFIAPMKTIYPGDNSTTLAQRDPPLNPVLHTPSGIFDAKMAVVNASLRGEIRGIALLLLLDLDRKPVILHDSSVHSLNESLDSERGSKAPHPFYLQDVKQRRDIIVFLRGLDTGATMGK
jgi:hypothetical protein